MVAFSDKLKTFPQQALSPYVPYGQTPRFVRDLGYGIKTPETAKTGEYIDKKCPFTGDISIRPFFIKGTVIKMKNERTIVVRKNYLFYQKKYKRYERRNTKFNVHFSPCFYGLVHVGDQVVCAETRSMSKTKHFTVVDYTQSAQNSQYPTKTNDIELIEATIQSIDLRRMLKTISLEYGREIEDIFYIEEEAEKPVEVLSNLGIILTSSLENILKYFGI